MKKFFLILALLTGASYCSAKAHASLEMRTDAASCVITPLLAQGDLVTSRTKVDFLNPVIVNSADSKLWYSRPVGILCPALTGYFEVTNSGWRRPMPPVLFMPPFTPVTLLNKSDNKASTEWSFKSNKTGSIPFANYEVTADNDLTLTTGAGRTAYYVPVLNRGAEQFSFYDKAPMFDKYPSYFMTDTLNDIGFEELPADVPILSSNGLSYYVGTTSDRIDFNQDGKKETVYMDGFHMFYPKPIVPIAVNRIDIPIVSDSGEFFSGFDGVTFTIYKVVIDPSGHKSFGDVIFTAEVNDDNFPQSPGVLMVGKQAHLLIYLTDDENGFMTFDDEFAIELKGFQREGVDIATRVVPRSSEARLTPEAVPYLYRDYINKLGEYVGSTTYAGNDAGVAISFYGCYDVLKVDNEKNTISVNGDGNTCTSNAIAYTTRSWDHYTLAELPEWVKSVTATTGDFGVHTLAVVCDPLPAGVESRSCTVKVKSFAGNLSNDVITITQGASTPGLKGDVNGDGKVDVADVNIIIDIILGNVTVEQYPAADVTGDGKVDVADVNAVIDIILAA